MSPIGLQDMNEMQGDHNKIKKFSQVEKCMLFRDPKKVRILAFFMRILAAGLHGSTFQNLDHTVG